MCGVNMLLPSVSLSYDEFVSLIRSEHAFNEDMVSYIDRKGLQHYLKFDDYISYLGKIDNLLLDKDITIKVEKYETMCNFNKGTVHIFYAKEGSPSFDEHCDPVDLMLQVTHGVKTIEMNQRDYTLHKGERLYIPASTLHRATNKYESIMLSWGINDCT